MRIGIDARFLTHPQLGGFKTYTEELVTALAAVDSRNEYVLYVDRPPDERTRLPRAANVRHVVLPATWPVLGTALREQVAVARQARRDRLDVLHEPCLTAPLRLGCPLVLTVHDTIWLNPRPSAHQRHPRQLRRDAIDWYQRVVGMRATALASVVVTVSEASRRNIMERLRLDRDRVVVTHEAARPVFGRSRCGDEVDAVLRQRGLTRPFLLGMGSSDPRKNIIALLDAYARLPRALRAATSLVVVWNYPPVSRELAERAAALGIPHDVRFLFDVSDVELVALYNAAEVFVHPSLEEGFGLPLLEAMACGAPVIAFDNSSIPEIAGDAALLVPTGSTEELARRMVEVLGDERLRSQLSARGIAQASEFSWERCARGTLAAYARAAHGRPLS